MTTTSTMASQHTDLGEGLALGCVAAGITDVPGGKIDIELAFRQVWRRWPYAQSFPAVHAGPNRDDLLHILNRSERRRSAHLTGWASQWPFVPYIKNDWDLDDVADLLADRTGVPLAGWVDLARGLVHRRALAPGPAERDGGELCSFCRLLQPNGVAGESPSTFACDDCLALMVNIRREVLGKDWPPHE